MLTKSSGEKNQQWQKQQIQVKLSRFSNMK